MADFTFNGDEIAKSFKGKASRVLKKTAEDALSLAQQLAPYKTGKLRNSGRVEEVSEETVLVGFTAKHAPFQEFGFRHYQSGEFIEGQPYMAPTWEEVPEMFLANAEKEFGD